MISIIVPIYNAEAYLAQCIESLLAQQTDEKIQILLIDDGSTDGSLAIAKSYEAAHTQIAVFDCPHAGQSAARNFGLVHAKGEYIAFVDADDSLEYDWCARHLENIGTWDYIQSGYKRTQGERVLSAKCPRHRFQFASPCMRLYRREVLDGLQFAEGYIYEDVLFSVDLWLSGAKGKIIDYTGYHYTLNPHSTTSCPHPEKQRLVLRTLRQKSKGQPLKGKLIILLTLIRLSYYFSVR